MSHTEAQRFLSAIVSEEIVRIDAARYEEPLDQTPAEWLGRVAVERAHRAAAEIASARGTAAILLAEDRDRLSAEGFGAEELGMFSAKLEEMREHLKTQDGAAAAAASSEAILGRAPTDARETRLLQQLTLSAQARALKTMDRVHAKCPMVGLETAVPGSAPKVQAALETVTLATTPCRLEPTVRQAEPSNDTTLAEPERTEVTLPQVEDGARPAKRSCRPIETDDEGDLLSEVRDGMLAREYPQAETPAEEKKVGKNRRQAKAILDQFIEIVGDKPLRDLTQRDCAVYVDRLALLPKIYGKSAEDRNRSVHELIARGEGLPSSEVGLSPQSVNRNLGVLRKLLKYGRRMGITPETELFLSDLRQKDGRDARSVWEAFTQSDLANLAAHPVWSGWRSVGRWHEPGCLDVRDGLFWGPLSQRIPDCAVRRSWGLGPPKS